MKWEGLHSLVVHPSSLEESEEEESEEGREEGGRMRVRKEGG